MVGYGTIGGNGKNEDKIGSIAEWKKLFYWEAADMQKALLMQ